MSEVPLYSLGGEGTLSTSSLAVMSSLGTGVVGHGERSARYGRKNTFVRNAVPAYQQFTSPRSAASLPPTAQRSSTRRLVT